MPAVASTPDTVHIHYRRPPDRRDIYSQRLVHRDADCIVTFMPRTPLDRPMIIDGMTALEPGSPVVWFTFPGAWHDIGRFHTADGRFTGIYSNVLTPVRFADEATWETTDLFVDVWLPAPGGAVLLDEDELDEAATAGWIELSLADRARAEARRLVRLAWSGEWPPAIVRAWTLDRVNTVIEPDGESAR